MRGPYRETGRAFDAVARRYDALYGPEGNAVMEWMRRESLALLKATFPRGSSLLEIGCGSGEEAIALAEAGRRVLATDLSPEMAMLAKAKAQARGVDRMVTALAAPAADLGLLRPRRPFDGAFASFGSLNCEPDLARLSTALTRLISPDGAFVCSVMPRCSPFETAWFLLHGRPRLAARRFRPGWQSASVGPGEGPGLYVLTRYLSIRQLRRLLSPGFSLTRTLSLPLLFPPPYLDTTFRRYRRTFAALEPLERVLRRTWPFRLWGDHVAAVFHRTGAGTS